jgi:hypothetical protein
MNIDQILKLPRADFETAISNLTGDVLELYAYGDRIEQLGSVIKEKFKDAATAAADSQTMISGNTFMVGDDKFSVRRTKVWEFDNPEHRSVSAKYESSNKETKKLKSSLSALEKHLIDIEEAILVEEKLSLSIAKK